MNKKKEKKLEDFSKEALIEFIRECFAPHAGIADYFYTRLPEIERRLKSARLLKRMGEIPEEMKQCEGHSIKDQRRHLELRAEFDRIGKKLDGLYKDFDRKHAVKQVSAGVSQ